MVCPSPHPGQSAVNNSKWPHPTHRPEASRFVATRHFTDDQKRGKAFVCGPRDVNRPGRWGVREGGQARCPHHLALPLLSEASPHTSASCPRATEVSCRAALSTGALLGVFSPARAEGQRCLPRALHAWTPVMCPYTGSFLSLNLFSLVQKDGVGGPLLVSDGISWESSVQMAGCLVVRV